MRVFIPVFFNAPLGGLQAHVQAQCKALQHSGNEAVVMCKPGPFSLKLEEQGVTVLKSDFSSIELSVESAIAAGPFDIVHAHPFKSRKVGLKVAQTLELPLIVTFHGNYLDDISSWDQYADTIICVSPALRDNIVSRNILPASKILLLTNSVDTRIYYPRIRDNAQDTIKSSSTSSATDEPRVAIASRFDEDKKFIIDLLKKTWQLCEEKRAFDIYWMVAGHGTLLEEIVRQAEELNQAACKQLVSFHGWLDEEALAEFYNQADLCVGPGRCALEAMACAKPVIALGSQGYVGLLENSVFQEGLYTNFGGLGSNSVNDILESMFHDIDRIVYDREYMVTLGMKSADLVNAFFSQEKLDAELLALYSSLQRPRSSSLKKLYTDVTSETWAYYSSSLGDKLNPLWHNHCENNSLMLSPAKNGHLNATCSFKNDDKAYLSIDGTAFSQPSNSTGLFTLDPGMVYKLEISYSNTSGNPGVSAWLIEYSDSKRIKHSSQNLKDGLNIVRFVTSPRTSSFRFMLRFSGEGTAIVSKFKLYRRNNVMSVLSCTNKRSVDISSFSQYAGQNLVFVLGAPRSGTTWVLKVLEEHPDVVAATVDNLDAKINDNITLETNIFNSTRPFTDAHIRWKFYQLSLRNPGKVIVEKTPIHLLFADRIRDVFSEAVFVLILRDGRDVVNSLLHVGRDTNSFWKGAPDTLEKAATLWNKYANAAINCINVHNPMEIRYEDLVDEPVGSFSQQFSKLGLSLETVGGCVESSNAGKNIPILKVFREGYYGSWKNEFTRKELDVFMSIAGENLLSLGYSAETINPSMGNNPTE